MFERVKATNVSEYGKGSSGKTPRRRTIFNFGDPWIREDEKRSASSDSAMATSRSNDSSSGSRVLLEKA
jgi:hypothetical protein